jgi:predicted ATPase
MIGRADAKARIGRLFLSDSGRLVTLIGIGGAGKTRLAIAMLSALAPYFLEGVYFVPLAGVSNSEGMLLAISQALNLHIRGNTPVVDQLSTYLQQKEVLLVLDNLEHLAEADAFLGKILEDALQVRILATSRRRLNMRWEHSIFVEGLEIGGPNDVLSQPAGRLFAQAGRRVRPDFTPESDDAAAIHRICSLLEGLPLGIELSTVWLRLLSCSQIAAEMEVNQQFIQRSVIGGRERHSSLWAAFNHSWHLLSDEVQAVFKALSVFRGGFPRWAAEQVAGADRAGDEQRGDPLTE